MAELHIISNGKLSWERLARIAGNIEPYITAFHIREKTKTVREIWEGIRLLQSYGVPGRKIYVNDRVDAAYAAKVKGVQLAHHSLEAKWVKSSFPELRVGCSVHSVKEAKEMERQGADFLLFGHIFPTGSKPGFEARGVSSLAQVVSSVRIPVIAIGGIKPENVGLVMEAGAAGIAVMSGVLEAQDALQMVRNYQHALLKGREKDGKGV